MTINHQDKSASLISEFIGDATPQTQEVVKRVINVIDSMGNDFDMAIKWRQLTFALDNDFHHWICAISITKRYTGLHFHFGGLLVDSHNKFKVGTSRFLRKIEIRMPDEVDEDVIRDFISQAVNKLPYFKANWKELKNQA